MNRGKKLILGLLVIVGLTLLAPLIIYNSQAAVLSLPKMKITYSLFIGQYLNLYLFWASLILFILLITLFFVILFWPKKERAVTVKDSNGEME
ncbi:alkaline shock response membrane anchor protein AmaP [Enterococcus sp. BWB1-3]|uniref:alkaline shock response membrane anchor protein AmaP n=1 Tax=Enterococcus sp. BWB1-3 TaxID=2787713 RepID=UPI001924C256|nr:alkaline shock response membrane anchor protein AmaP [Enterococcus sp. BWB1-3]MBL1227651.1 alkaline shock response membrane anchor protein AmaP [Enterococcus sp. BWB1-3]